MAFVTHVKFTPGGSVPGPDIWRTSIRCDLSTGGMAPTDFDTINGLRDSAIPMFTAWATTLQPTLWESETDFNTLRVSQVGPDGLEIAASDGPVPVVTGAGAGALPPQTALVITMRTGRPGRKFRGRSYCPLTASQAMDTSGNKVLAGTQTVALNAYESLLEALSTLILQDVQLRPVVASRGSLLSAPGVDPPVFGPGANTQITQISCGDLADSQRRRRNARLEVYTNRTIG